EVNIRNPQGVISVLEINNENEAIEGLVIEVDGHVRVIGGGASVSYDKGSTRITFPVLGEGKKRQILIRV
ncbi:hypothetical protein KKA03_01260, partial [archaeon]|nr:hypothetical protein [archaeon]